MTEVTDPVRYSLEQLQAYGLQVEQLQLGAPPNGKAHRVPTEDDKKGKKSGWYIAHLIRLGDGREAVVGAYGRFVGAECLREKFRLPEKSKLTVFDRNRIRQQQKKISQAAEEARDEAAQAAAQKAREIWAKLPSCSGSPYLTAKGVSAFGLAAGKDGTAVVPMRNVSGALMGLQFIQSDGSKRFLTGQRKQGSFHMIGSVAEQAPIVLAEGYATVASIHQATGWPVVVCFDAGNLASVAEAIHQKYPAAQLLFAGDDDHEKKDNAGRKQAIDAAERFSADVVFPRFRDPGGKTDFNDLHAAEGLQAVAEQVKSAFRPLLPAAAIDTRDQPWTRELIFDRGQLKPMVHNVMLVLQHHPAWVGTLGYDTFQKRLLKRKPTPYGGKPGPMEDPDEINIAAWFGRRDTYASNITTSVAREASIAVATSPGNTFHPVRDYLGALKWDGHSRIPTFFQSYCGVREDAGEGVTAEVLKTFALNFFIAAVARVYKPGCRAKLMLVLEGEQDKQKSSLAWVLAGGDEWYVDLGTSPGDKDFYQIIQGRWIVEISELAAFAKAETSQIKRAVSMHTDTFRPSYGRNVMQFPRECVFFGTANDGDWQRDATGGARYMPVWIEQVDLDAVENDRDQLWAEAVFRFNDGETWWTLPPQAREAQESRYLDDIWVERVEQWLEGKSHLQAPKGAVTMSEILSDALGIELKKQDRQMQIRAGQIMRRLGWSRKQVRLSGRTRIYRYLRPNKSEGTHG